jgi:geranylgeranyl diphosphate synthase type II
MDKAPLRRGHSTVHAKFDEPTALLAGDVLLVMAYEHINKISGDTLKKIMQLFNKTAIEVCEGQQMDMEFEKNDNVSQQDYLHMIELKTSVLLAESLQMGAKLGGAGLGNQNHLYEFGKNIGIAFQVQDDFLDAFGDPGKFGKQVGGDIRANKKTFLLIHALEECGADNKKDLLRLMKENPEDKVDQVLGIFKKSGVDQWASELQKTYTAKAMQHLEDVAVLTTRKEPLKKLAEYLLTRDK